MTEILARRKKSEKSSTRKELELLDKSDLIDRVLRLEAHNMQLKTLMRKAANRDENRKCDASKTQKRFDFSRCHKRHILLRFYYLGWEYSGFTVQEDTNNTVEHQLFSALVKSCCVESRESANYHRCGRTDKGVSAFSQVISLDVRSRLEPENQSDLSNELPYCKLLNRLLPRNIRCVAWCPAPDDFSARFDCKYRTYKYIFPRGDLDVDAMDTAVKYAVGSHDFRNICKMDVANGVTNFQRTIMEAKVASKQSCSEKPSGYDMCELVIKSQAFLWHQIRCLMGVLVLVGRGKEEPKIVSQLLDIENCPRKPQYNLAHEIPLNLYYCEYENKDWFIDEKELTNVIKTLQQDWTLNAVKSTMIRDMLMDLKSTVNLEITNSQSDCLLLGVHSKVYQPLMKRMTCESLESKIEHYKKRRKLGSNTPDPAQ